MRNKYPRNERFGKKLKVIFGQNIKEHLQGIILTLILIITPVKIQILSKGFPQRHQKKWIDWLSSYNDRLEEYEQYSPEQRKDFLEGIIDNILVRYDKESNEHHLKISFIMPLVDDGIKYKTDDKSSGYDLVDGETDTVIGITPTPRGKKSTHLLNYSTVIEYLGF